MLTDALINVLCYLITSARGCLDEPPIYGPLRLVETYSLLVEAIGKEKIDNFFWQQKEKIDEFKSQAMYDEKVFTEALDQAVIDFAKFIREREEI